MTCRVKKTGSGITSYEGKYGLEHDVPHGVYTLKRSDGRYTLTGDDGKKYLIVAPAPHGAGLYLDQQKSSGTLQLIEGEWP